MHLKTLEIAFPKGLSFKMFRGRIPLDTPDYAGGCPRPPGNEKWSATFMV